MIGSGGMGRVYLAEDIKLHMKWAIKEIACEKQYMPGASTSGTSGTSGASEISVLRHASHPNLPRITDVFSEKGYTYIVMDYIEGRTLSEIISSGKKVPGKIKLGWMTETASALSYLHSKKPAVVYRDLKPSNIMVRNNGSVALIDFGTAKQYRDREGFDAAAFGTRGYAAPEQFEGVSDQRSDVYAFGCTMKALYGRSAPFMLKQLIAKCMRRDPDERYRDAGEVARALYLYKACSRTVRGIAAAVLLSIAVLLSVRHENAAAEDRVQEMVETGRYEEIFDYALMCFYDLEDYPEAMRYLKQIPEENVPEIVYYKEITAMQLSMDANEDEIMKILGRFEKFNENGIAPEDVDRKMKNALNMARIYMTYADEENGADKEAVRLSEEVLGSAGSGQVSRIYYKEALSLLSDIYRQMGQEHQDSKYLYYKKAIIYSTKLMKSLDHKKDEKLRIMKYRDIARMLEELNDFPEACTNYEKCEREYPYADQDIYIGHLALLIRSDAQEAEIKRIFAESGKVNGINDNSEYLKIKERLKNDKEN